MQVVIDILEEELKIIKMTRCIGNTRCISDTRCKSKRGMNNVID